MIKSASETTLKTPSTPNGTDNIDYSRDDAEIRDAEAQALRWLEQGHDFILEKEQLFDLDLDTNAGMLQIDLLALEKAHHLTGHGNNDVEWAYGVLAPTRTEEAATPAVRIFLRSLPPGTTPWTIPEQIHGYDLSPFHDGLLKRAVVSQARLALFDRWDAEEKAAQAAAAQRAESEARCAEMMRRLAEENAAALAAWRATPEQQERMREHERQRLPEDPEAARKEARADAAQREAQLIFTKITGRPGMAEAAGWHAHDAVSRHGMSVGEAIRAAIKHLSMWTWATREALAKREAARASQELVDKRWLAIYGATEA
jgi:hypothetical protein